MDRDVTKKKPELKPMDLMATTAHELKSPLVLINGLAGMLKGGQFGQLSSRQARYVSRIDNASDRLLTMVENLLTINRSQNGRLSLDFESISVARVLDQILAEMQPKIAAKKMTVVWSPQLQLPAVLADEQLLYQALYNLIDNSVKYSPEQTTLTVKFRSNSGRLQILISDQGFGIKSKDLDRLFERFGTFQTPVTGQAASSGLGLYIVKNLIEVMGGEISAQRLRQGTRFTIDLPIVSQLELFSEQ